MSLFSVLARITAIVLVAWVGSAHAIGIAPPRAWNGDTMFAGDLVGPLRRDEAALYQRVFQLQADGRMDEAGQLLRYVSDPLLLGHVLAQRYLHPTAYISEFEELKAWLQLYPDHPQAQRIYSLALRKNPDGEAQLAEPMAGYIDRRARPARPDAAIERAQGGNPVLNAAIEEAEALLDAGELRKALAVIEAREVRRHLGSAELDLWRWRIASAFFAANRDLEALQLANHAAARSGVIEPRINWTAGLAAWRLNQPALAARHFEALAKAEDLPRSETARAAFWAARALMKSGKPQEVRHYLQIAAQNSLGFYGLLARATLSEDASFDWSEPQLDRTTSALLLGHPATRRALALVQVHQLEMAEDELTKLVEVADPPIMQATAQLAKLMDLPIARELAPEPFDFASEQMSEDRMAPLPDWLTRIGGLDVDRALVYAFAKAESTFDPDAISSQGARGLMQIMPVTAEEVAESEGVQLATVDALHDPEVSLQLGSTYLDNLMDRRWIRDDLIKLAMSYNAGPSRLSEVLDDMPVKDDPLLLIEAFPIAETRHHAKKVLANLWLYRLRLGQPTPSLDALAANEWPRYVALD